MNAVANSLCKAWSGASRTYLKMMGETHLASKEINVSPKPMSARKRAHDTRSVCPPKRRLPSVSRAHILRRVASASIVCTAHSFSAKPKPLLRKSGISERSGPKCLFRFSKCEAITWNGHRPTTVEHRDIYVLVQTDKARG